MMESSKVFSVECQTVGELRKALDRWPDDKPLILDDDGNTYPVTITEWAEAEANDLDWPAAIMVDR